jgi:hypothetical protein
MNIFGGEGDDIEKDKMNQLIFGILPKYYKNQIEREALEKLAKT